MKWTVCDESSSSSSSSDEVYPILPNTLPDTTSGELSPIEESHLEKSGCSSSSSKYMSSFANDSLSNVSDISDDDQRCDQDMQINSSVESNNFGSESTFDGLNPPDDAVDVEEVVDDTVRVEIGNPLETTEGDAASYHSIREVSQVLVIM